MSSNPLIVVGVFLLVLLAVTFAYGILTQRQRGGVKPASSSSPDWVDSLSQPAAPGGERMASLISEQIEDLVHARLQTDPAFKDLKIDFGTATDGTLEIWLNDERYLDVEAIPDERVRGIIQEAVTAYNEGLT